MKSDRQVCGGGGCERGAVSPQLCVHSSHPWLGCLVLEASRLKEEAGGLLATGGALGLLWLSTTVSVWFALQAFLLPVFQVHVPWSPCGDEHFAGQHQCFLCSHDSHNKCVGLRSVCCY